MKAKITNIKDNGIWTSSDGTVFFKFDFSFDNGEAGSALTKSNPPAVKVGDEVEFTIEEKNGHKNVKFAKPSTGGFTPKVNRNPEEEAKRQLWIVRQSSLKAAVELCSNNKILYDDVLKVSQQFTDWVMGNIPAQPMNVPTNEMPF